MKKMSHLLSLFLGFALVLSLVPVIGTAADQFTMESYPGGTQKDVIVNGEHRVIYCMQYDYLWPVTGEGYANDPTPYEKAMSIDLLTAEQQDIIRRVLYAGYPYDSIGALKPVYDAFGTYGAESAADITQAVIWTFMSQWNVPGNSHFVIGTEDLPGWSEAYNAIMDYALNGDPLPHITEGFKPEVVGSTLLTKHGDKDWRTDALSITNPTGLKVMYYITAPDGAVILDKNGNEMIENWSFDGNDWVNLGYLVYGGDTFYVQFQDTTSVEGKSITIKGSATLPSSVSEYKTDATGLGDKHDGQGYVQHPFQTMLSVGITTANYSNRASFAKADETVTIHGTKTWNHGANPVAQQPTSIQVHLHANGDLKQNLTVQPDANGNWTYTFANLPKYDEHGAEINYTVDEGYVQDYTATYQGYNIINTYAPGKTSLNVEKIWDDADNHDGLRPLAVTVKLFADGANTGRTVALTEANGWRGVFDNLPERRDDGTHSGAKISYTVQEVPVQSYTSSITEQTDSEGRTVGYIVKNTHAPEFVSISGIKTWNHGDNPADQWPTSIPVHLHVDGVLKEIKTVLVDAGGNWTYTFADLPKYNNQGTLINYTVDEGYVYDYTATYQGYNITNTYAPGKTSLNVEKAWHDNDNNDGIRPYFVTVKLLADGVDTGKSVILTETNGWQGVFTDLPERKDDGSHEGTPITYTVQEVPVDGYTSSVRPQMDQEGRIVGFLVTNTHTAELVTISGKKTWNHGTNPVDQRPASIQVHLHANGALLQNLTVKADENGNWTYTFADLPKYSNQGTLINYMVDEGYVQDYSTSYQGYNITNTYAPGKTSLNVEKAWYDNDNNDGIRPASVTVKLLADGVDTGKTVTLSAANNWRGVFENLSERYDDGSHNGALITYSVEEVPVSGYLSDVTPQVDSEGRTVGFLVSNTHTAELVTISGRKTWNHGTNPVDKRPTSIQVHLHANGALLQNLTVKADENGNWTYTFADLPKYNNQGTLINYMVDEGYVQDYSTSYQGYNITNTYAPSKTSLNVEKAWYDNDNSDGIRPASVTVKLLADGVDTGKTVTLSAANNWRGVFENLSERYDDGSHRSALITYTVEEVPVSGYLSDVTPQVDSEGRTVGFLVSNMHTAELVTISGRKTWNHGENPADQRPTSIQVHLHANGELKQVKTVQADANGNWTWSFTGLPKFDQHGELINYIVDEGYVHDYSASYEGYNIINTYAPGQTSLNVEKIWNDDANSDGSRPASVTVKLLADGVDTGKTVTLSETTSWRAVFENLPEMRNDGSHSGAPIVYTVEEVPVSGYTSTVKPQVDGEGRTVGFIVTNTHATEYVTLSGRKVWDDNDDQYGKRPFSIVIHILADGKVVDTITPSKTTGWDWSVTDLPAYHHGKEIVYTVTEEPVAGYITDITGNFASGITVTNKYAPDATGSLTVTKRVKGNAGEKNRKFHFTVTLHDKTINGKYGEMTFVNGVAELKLKHGETRTATNLPAGIRYSVTEDDYSKDGYVTEKTGHKGTIVANQAAKAKFVNTKDVVVPKTGDSTDIGIFAALLAGAGIALVLLLRRKRKA